MNERLAFREPLDNVDKSLEVALLRLLPLNRYMVIPHAKRMNKALLIF